MDTTPKTNQTANAEKLEDRKRKVEELKEEQNVLVRDCIKTFLQKVVRLGIHTCDTEMFEDIDDDVKPYFEWVESLKKVFDAATSCHGEIPEKLMKCYMGNGWSITDFNDEKHDMFDILLHFSHALREKFDDDCDEPKWSNLLLWLEGLTKRLTTEEEEEVESRVPKVGDIYQRKDVKHYDCWSGWVHHHPVTSGNKLGMGRSYQDIMLPGHKIKIVDVITRPCKAGVYHTIHFESCGGKIHGKETVMVDEHGNETVSYQCYKSYYFKFKYYMELAPKMAAAKPAKRARKTKKAAEQHVAKPVGKQFTEGCAQFSPDEAMLWKHNGTGLIFQFDVSLFEEASKKDDVWAREMYLNQCPQLVFHDPVTATKPKGEIFHMFSKYNETTTGDVAHRAFGVDIQHFWTSKEDWLRDFTPCKERNPFTLETINKFLTFVSDGGRDGTLHSTWHDDYEGTNPMSVYNFHQQLVARRA